MTTDTFVVNSAGKSSIFKDPNAVLDYTFDWTSWFADLDDTDTISSISSVIDSGLTLDRSSFSGYLVSFIISGGIDQTNYNVTCRITTINGRIDDRSFTMKIRQR